MNERFIIKTNLNFTYFKNRASSHLLKRKVCIGPKYIEKVFIGHKDIEKVCIGPKDLAKVCIGPKDIEKVQALA